MQWTRLLSTYPLHGFELEEEKDLGSYSISVYDLHHHLLLKNANTISKGLYNLNIFFSCTFYVVSLCKHVCMVMGGGFLQNPEISHYHVSLNSLFQPTEYDKT